MSFSLINDVSSCHFMLSKVYIQKIIAIINKLNESCEYNTYKFQKFKVLTSVKKWPHMFIKHILYIDESRKQKRWQILIYRHQIGNPRSATEIQRDPRKNESDLPDTRSPCPMCSTHRPVARPSMRSDVEKQETNCSISDRPAWASTCGNHRARRGVLSGPRSERSDSELTDWLAVYLRCIGRVLQGDVSLYCLLPCVPWRATGRKR